MALARIRTGVWRRYVQQMVKNTSLFRSGNATKRTDNKRLNTLKDYSSDSNAAVSTSYPKSSKPSKMLFTPGPLMVSERVKLAMGKDIGSRHSEFEYLLTFIRKSLVRLAGGNVQTHTAIPMTGSGTFAIESTLTTALAGSKGKVLVLSNGMYGERIASLCKQHGMAAETVRMHSEALEQRLQQSDDVIAVVSVHCETTTGVLNPVFDFGKIIKNHSKDCLFIVDAISSFGGVPYDVTNIDYVIGSSCKCLQGIPGISFVIANASEIEKKIGQNKILTLDLAGQYAELERTGQFRFTPPTHLLLAFKEALLELEDEGGLEKRIKRFQENASVLNQGMNKLGFQRQIFSEDKNSQRHIVTSFQYPENPRFVYGDFIDRLDRRGFQLPAERTNIKGCFRVGTIGNIYPEDLKMLVDGIEDVCGEMDIKMPLY